MMQKALDYMYDDDVPQGQLSLMNVRVFINVCNTKEKQKYLTELS